VVSPDTVFGVDSPIGGMFGEQSFESVVGRLVCTDLLVHTWDLARATDHDEQLDPGAITTSREFLAAIDDGIRSPGGFAVTGRRTDKVLQRSSTSAVGPSDSPASVVNTWAR
jgi:hypothetical protein